MFFGAYLGYAENLAAWQEVMQRHAAWLGLASTIKRYELDDGRNFSFGWLNPKRAARPSPLADAHIFARTTQETREDLVITTSGAITFGEEGPTIKRRLITNVDTNVIKLGISCQSGELRVVVPPATPEQFYFSRDSRGYVFGNDMRLLMRWAGGEYDERAIYGLFQFGAIPPPLTMSKKVQRVPGGHILKIRSNVDEPALEAFFYPGREALEAKTLASPAETSLRQALRQAQEAPQDAASARASGRHASGTARQRATQAEVQVRETLDTLLACVPSSATLYFSGGVDSTLMASRLVSLGRTDIKLINFAFGPQDPEGHLALQMAEHLKLPCTQIMYEPSNVPKVLERLGKDYTFPFGDQSVIPTNLLVHASLPSLEPALTVIEGTGADGAFGLWGTDSRISALPTPFRWLLAAGYKGLKAWQSVSEFERIGGLARGSLQMPLSHEVVMAQNFLNGIAYRMPDKVEEAVAETIRGRIEGLGEGLPIKAQFSLLDLSHVCAGIFAAKSFAPLRAQGVNPIYPFLEPPMVRLSLGLPDEVKNAGGQSKALLKSLLAQSVPPELVYRRKSGFIPPFQEILSYPATQEFMRNVLLSPQNPLLDFCRRGTLKQIVERASQGEALSMGARRFLWVSIFTSGWLQQLELN